MPTRPPSPLRPRAATYTTVSSTSFSACRTRPKIRAAALVGGQLLDAAYQRTWRESLQPTNPSDPNGLQYGYGIVQVRVGPNRILFHNGELPGYNTFAGYDPVNRVTLVDQPARVGRRYGAGRSNCGATVRQHLPGRAEYGRPGCPRGLIGEAATVRTLPIPPFRNAVGPMVESEPGTGEPVPSRCRAPGRLRSIPVSVAVSVGYRESPEIAESG